MCDPYYIGLFQEADFLEGYEQGKTEEEIINQSLACKALAAKGLDPKIFVGRVSAKVYDNIGWDGVVEFRKNLAQKVLRFESDDLGIAYFPSNMNRTKDLAALVNYYAAKYGCDSLLQADADNSRAEIAQLIPESMSYIGYSERRECCALENLFLKLIDKKNGSVYLHREDGLLPESGLDVEVLLSPIGRINKGVLTIPKRKRKVTAQELLEELVKKENENVPILSFSRGDRLPESDICIGRIGSSLLLDVLAATRKIALCISCTYWEPAYTALLEKDAIDTVLTWCHDRLLILNRNKPHKGYVRFVNACELTVREEGAGRLDNQFIAMLEDATSDNDKSFMVPNQTILDNHAILNENRYLALREIEKTKNIVGDRKKAVLLRDLVEPIFSPQEVESPIPVLYPCDLPRHPFEFAFGENSIRAQKVSARSQWCYVEEPAILVPRKNAPLQPTYFTAKCGGIYVPSRGIIVYRVDTSKVKIEYLMNEMTKDYVRRQFWGAFSQEEFFPGSFDDRFKQVIDESLNIQIFLPGSMDEQAEEVADKKFGKESMNQLYLRDFSSMPAHSAKKKEEPKDDPNQLSLF